MKKDIQFSTLIDLVKVFPDERSCHGYLAEQRWGGCMECPYHDCDGTEAYMFRDGIRYKCKSCKRIYTAKTGTFMEASKLPTIKWIMAVYLVLHKNGISSVQLSKDIGVTQKTAWFVLHRIRQGFANAAPDKLEGTVLADETFVGGKNKNRHRDKKVRNSQGRSFRDKTPVLGLMGYGKTTTVKCIVIGDTKVATIQPIVKGVVSKGSHLVSDEWSAYEGMGNLYTHAIVDHGRGRYATDDGYSTNALEGFWSQAKRSIHGTYIRPTGKHMEKYFNEFTFRHNHRDLNIQGQIGTFVSNMEGRIKYRELTA